MKVSGRSPYCISTNNIVLCFMADRNGCLFCQVGRKPTVGKMFVYSLLMRLPHSGFIWM